ncbi:aspartate aminotransferase family protein [Alkaliphilus pronyensis]|uniref:Aspartate aminotransferase family protein n=1 Tax=Alkaliphilus pronyensis TaxID=1482732 RepID=A0A6I0EYC4_9FIRM|nr:aspartate aminotransferase family protein [Alkaliphilus pronyensis]KAB3533473.1 aspartate aminotransferase family protein [Alkaliphilus pronyensis]
MNKNLLKDIDRVWHPYVQMEAYKEKPTMIVEADGIYVKDIRGKTYIDGISSLWNVCLGHNNKKVINSITEQLNSLQYFSLYGYTNQPSVELSLMISDITDNRYKRFFFTNSGSEAADSAIKIIRQYFKNKGEANRTKIVSLEKSFHGVTYGAISAGGIPIDSQQYKPVLSGFIKIPPPYCFRCYYNKKYPECNLACGNKLEEVIIQENPETVAAFMAEPILGAGGIIIPPKGYFTRLKEICDKYGVKLIIDEVSTGFGRLGTGLGIDNWNVKPQIFIGAKGISSGYLPLGVVGVEEDIYEAFLGDKKQLNHGFTTSGHPVSCKAGIATLRVIKEENLIKKVKDKEVFFRKQLQQLMNISIVKDIRGMGLMWGIELIDKYDVATLTYEIAKRKGLITFITDASNVIALFPPFITTEEQLVRIKEVMEASLKLAEERVKIMLK